MPPAKSHIWAPAIHSLARCHLFSTSWWHAFPQWHTVAVTVRSMFTKQGSHWQEQMSSVRRRQEIISFSKGIKRIVVLKKKSVMMSPKMIIRSDIIVKGCQVYKYGSWSEWMQDYCASYIQTWFQDKIILCISSIITSYFLLQRQHNNRQEMREDTSAGVQMIMQMRTIKGPAASGHVMPQHLLICKMGENTKLKLMGVIFILSVLDRISHNNGFQWNILLDHNCSAT